MRSLVTAYVSARGNQRKAIFRRLLRYADTILAAGWDEPAGVFLNDQPEGSNDILSWSTQECGFSFRTSNCLQAAGIGTVQQLRRVSEEDLLGLRNFGIKSLQEVNSFLERHRIRRVGTERASDAAVGPAPGGCLTRPPAPAP